MFGLSDILELVKEFTYDLNQMNQEQPPQESERDLKKKEMKRKAVPDILNSSLEAIEKTENINHAIASLRGVSTTFMSAEGKALISSALSTVAAQGEAHQATGETDMTEQVALAAALAELAKAMAKQLEERAKSEAKHKAKIEEENEPKPDDGITYMLLALGGMQGAQYLNTNHLNILQDMLRVMEQPAPTSRPHANKPVNIQREMMAKVLENKIAAHKNENAEPERDRPSAFSTKTPKAPNPRDQ